MTDASRFADLPKDQKDWLKDAEKRLLRYFIDHAHPKTGLVRDRAPNFGGPDDLKKEKYRIASIASTGFGLVALAVGAKRGLLPDEEARERALRTLRFVSQMPQEHGWLYHFLDNATGEREWKCELSSIDTALFIAGALPAGEQFKGTEIETLARRLFDRIDFDWMRTNGGAMPDEMTLCMGWKPESGFLTSRWADYSEQTLLNLLALSSETHPVPDNVWTAWERDVHEIGPYKGLGLDLPLFVHQYVHCFADLKGKTNDKDGWDYWDNSATATKANRWYCIHRAEEFKGFGPDGWGLSACDGPDGYRAYAPRKGEVDGTLSPIGLIAAIPFLPTETLSALMAMREEHGDWIWGRYGPSAYNLSRNWRGEDMIGIDAGAALLMLDRYLYGDSFIPRLAEKAGLSRGLKRAGFGA